MKLLFVNGHLQVGGVEKSLVNLLNSVDYSHNEVDLLLFEGSGEYLDLIPPEVNIIYCDLRGTYGSFFHVLKQGWNKENRKNIVLKAIFTLASKISPDFIKLMRYLNITPGEYDCAIAYRVGISADYVAYAIKSPKKFVWWHNGQFDYPQKVVKHWKAVFSKMNYIVCVSECTRKMLSKYYKREIPKMKVIPNMIDQQEIKQKANGEIQMPSGKVILVSVGRLSEEKHMADAVPIMKKLREKGMTNVIWYLAGDGAEREKIERNIEENQLQNQLIMLGALANPYPYIKAADIFVHLSHVESQGMTVLEAMALNRVCVVARSEGVQEFIIDGKNGFLCDGTIGGETAAIIKAMSFQKSKDYCECQSATVEKYSPNVIMNQLETLMSMQS